MKITRKDIARMAGVSTATVSYVINGSNRVGEETRERVQKIIEEYNYRPDLIARAMSTRSTMQIALLVNDLFNNFFAEIVTEFEKAAIQEGYCVNICTSDRNIASYLDSFVTRRIDGVFCMVGPTRIDMQKLYALRQDDIPVLISG
ncbi:MAG: LacI family DNA-binding transcriptional regulator, partial [Clostridia bacterium]|nr:LacI family DNA-binding transcriptional regulator [Clostridia bacterium]